MKKIMIALVALSTAQAVFTAFAEPQPGNSSTQRPVPQEYYRRFVAADSFNGQNFYWLDSTSGHLWEFDRSLEEWEDHGRHKEMGRGPNGTYILWSDRRDGVYILNSDTGKGWWFDGTRWESIDPANSAKTGDNSIY